MLISIFSNAQLTYNSPYSRLGVGLPNLPGTGYNQSLGGTGIAQSSHLFYNGVNPANLQRNRYTIYEVSLYSEARQLQSSTSKQNNTDGISKQNSTDGNLENFTLAFPVSKRTNFSLGLSPYSKVSYDFNSVTVLSETEEARHNYTGSGGLSQAHLAVGARIINDTTNNFHLSLGLQSEVMFGTIISGVQSQIYTNNNPALSKTYTETDEGYVGFAFKPGITARKEIIKNTVKRDTNNVVISVDKKHTGTFVSVGAIYHTGTSLKGDYVSIITTQLNSTGASVIGDTTRFQGNTLRMPSSVGFGISIDRPFPAEKSDQVSVWSVGADVKLTQWNLYENSLRNEMLNNTMRASLGAEFAPDIVMKKRTGYFNRVYYRAGLFYENMPFQIANDNLNHVGMNFGMTFPLGKFSARNMPKYLTLNVIHGKYGKVTDEFVADRYTRLVVTFTVNAKWFDRYKVGL